MNDLEILLLQDGGRGIRLLGLFIAMIILYYFWNVRDKKKEMDDNDKMI